MSLAALLAATSGALLGAIADRLAARWPDHETEQVRRVDWRTIAVVIGGAVAFVALLARWNDPRDLIVLGIYFAALVVLMATDLDQRLLPDVVTLPLIGFSLAMLILGWDPLLAGKDLGVVSGIAAGIGAPIFLLATNRLLGGGLGMGDVKLAVSLGLMSGVSRLFAGFLLASAASSVILVALILTRRLGLRSAIPFGPILIAGGIIAALLP
ncbi:MAG: prepilin peptidase [Chloroflexi bacterium]|nr:prepilin peptidase [Chloroflexota bacterium]HEV8053810.1 A24 family peptidase [Candidatus Limnocylindrales bacterium]